MSRFFFEIWYKVFKPIKNQISTRTHHNIKNQSFFEVPFHSRNSNTTNSKKKSKDSKATKPKIQIKKKFNNFTLKKEKLELGLL